MKEEGFNQESEHQEQQEIVEQQSSKEQEKDKSRIIRLIEKSHKQALLAFKIEELLSGKELHANNGKKKDPLEEQKKLLDQLPEEIAQKFAIIIENYSKQRQTSLQENWKLVEMLEGFEGLKDKPITPLIMGQEIFNMRVGANPLGKVEFFQDEGYFVMRCEDPIDYACALEGKVFDQTSQKSLKSGGTFHHSMRLTFNSNDISTPVLLIRGPDEAYRKKIVVHERQHFINHILFRKFKDTEKFESADYFRDLKDEVLAYIRDGSSGRQLKESLYGDLYTHLFANTPPEQRNTVSKVIDSIANFMDNYYAILGRNQEVRAILAYQLAGIPFEEFPKWLSAYAEYYRERSELLEMFYSTEIEIDLLYDKFPWVKQSAPVLENICDLHAKISKIKEKASNLIYDLSKDPVRAKKEIDDLLSEFNRLNENIRKASKKIMQNGAVMPHSSDSQLYVSWMGVENFKFEENETTKKIETLVLDEIKNFPQKEIDKIVYNFINYPEALPQSLEKLEKIIKNIIKKENDGESCQINFRRGGMYDNSFVASVSYKFSKTDQRKGFGGAMFDLHFHSTKFEIVKLR